MAGEIEDAAQAEDASAGVPVELTDEGKKQAKIAKEKAKLLTSLAAGDFSDQRTRVAMILSLYKQARNSDVVLALKYWKTFNADVYHEEGILPSDLFKLERIPIIVRARAKIQNEYGLFQADEGIRQKRRGKEEEMFAAIIEDVDPDEVESGRVTLPRDVRMTLDEEQSLDKIALNEMKGRLEATLRRDFPNQVSISEIVTISSKKSALVQLADLIAGAANRKLNPQQERGYKDEMAEFVMEELGLVLADDDVPGLDAATMFFF